MVAQGLSTAQGAGDRASDPASQVPDLVDMVGRAEGARSPA